MSESQVVPEAEPDDPEWQSGQGESPDNHTMAALQLAHRAVEKFPDLRRRYQKYVGPVAVLSSAVVVLASVAISRRMHRGQTPDSILAEITPEEIESVGREKPPKPQNKPRRMPRFLH